MNIKNGVKNADELKRYVNILQMYVNKEKKENIKKKKAEEKKKKNIGNMSVLEKKLTDLKDLHDKGLISDDVYSDKQKEILEKS